jgi:membrane-associated phospholipid phosphatase
MRTVRAATVVNFLRHENRWHRFFYLSALITLMYLLTNRWHLFPPTTVQKTWIDTGLPFIPTSVVIYTSYFMTIISVFVLEDDQAQLDRYCLALLGLNIFCNVIFVFYPTTYDARPPLVASSLNSLSWWIDAQFRFIYFFDSPANCFPSLHVANSFLATLQWFRRYPRRFAFFLAWTLLICLSTLTTKQHYFYDLLSGLGAALLWYKLPLLLRRGL